MIVLKLGGSVITKKAQPETIDETALQTAADRLSETEESLVLVHGGGSFGHYHAQRHGVSEIEGTRDPEAIADIHEAMCSLNREVLGVLRAAGCSPLAVHPLSVGHRDQTGELTLPTEHIAVMLHEGFMPVLHGDLIAHAKTGTTVVSGDELLVRVADALDADRVGLCSDVPGVLGPEGEVIPSIESDAEVADMVGGSESPDVTGGMAAKIRSLTRLSGPASVFDLSGLSAFLAGERPGTTVR